ncbi:MAG: adenylate/guanylate cyclase domain-containing protein [Methylococcales bacterium]|nr:adenylate/guanylate cyclase domain-containing protein [Methylococcales bacterium]
MNDCIKTFKVFLCALLLGISAALFSLTPLGTQLEEELGLPWLFQLRGGIPPSEQIIIVSIDKVSAEILSLPEDPEKWPRSYYAQLIEKLNRQNPSIIALNMTFGESRGEENDQLLAEAMDKGKNIVLSNYIKQNIVRTNNGSNQFKYEQIIDPLPLLESAALITAPFPLPKTASTVKQFWTYKNSAGDITTFPVAIFQSYVFKQVYPEILQLLSSLNPSVSQLLPSSFDKLLIESNIIEFIQTIQTIISSDSQSLERLNLLIKEARFSVEKKRLLNAWIALLKSPDSLYFNHYGSAGTIPTIPFYQALVSDILNPELFKNKVVLIGVSENIEPEKNQGFYTVFSKTDRDIVSPIEIAATAVANLINNTWLKPLSLQNQFLVILMWSIILFGICHFFTYKLAIYLVIISNLLYLLFAFQWFYSNSIWLPLFIPFLVLTPIVLTFQTIVFFLEGKRERKSMEKAFSLYIPNSVVSSFKKNHDASTMGHYGELMFGVCMSTDAEQYTALSENMKPEKLNTLINEYYSVMFPLVTKNEGIISDIIGDAMFAIWTSTDPTAKTRLAACLSALEILQAITQFNHAQFHPLPTRIGLHFGEIRLGNVGAADHYEYRAVGDTVNTATRIEGLNKYLNTQILVSADVIKSLSDFTTREVGFFILKGKSHPVHIYELISNNELLDSSQRSVITAFIKGLKLFQQQKWSEALQIWLELERVFPNDGPTLFYIQYLKENLHLIHEHTDQSQPTVISMGNITNSLVFNH